MCRFSLALAWLTALVPAHTAVNAAAAVLPSANQLKLLDWDMTAFVHFSITTYTGSQAGNQDPTKFAPDPRTLNISQWVATVKSMGAKVAVLTSKHEAGFWWATAPLQLVKTPAVPGSTKPKMLTAHCLFVLSQTQSLANEHQLSQLLYRHEPNHRRARPYPRVYRRMPCPGRPSRAVFYPD